MKTSLIHYAEHPVVLDRGRTYTQLSPRSPFGKPEGLWVSVPGEDDWPSWCNENERWLDGLNHAHEVTLSPEANILRLETAAKLSDFHREHRISDEISLLCGSRPEMWPVDWASVAEIHDGVVIAPYQWGHRKFSWYYGWDCASGCVWNLDAVTSLTSVIVQSGVIKV